MAFRLEQAVAETVMKPSFFIISFFMSTTSSPAGPVVGKILFFLIFCAALLPADGFVPAMYTTGPHLQDV